MLNGVPQQLWIGIWYNAIVVQGVADPPLLCPDHYDSCRGPSPPDEMRSLNQILLRQRLMKNCNFAALVHLSLE
jgi:hypothetical protein